MFFARQRSNQCGLHAIHNVLKSAAITKDDMRSACEGIEKKTGDALHNHETFGGDWSVSAVLEALRARDFEVYPAVQTKQSREWQGPSMDDLLQDSKFRGIILHQPMQRHFTCIRPETQDGVSHLYYVDSQSDGPRRISSRLATRRCLAEAYAWEPFVVRGDPVEYVPVNETAQLDIPNFNLAEITQRERETPPQEFLDAWRSFNSQGAQAAAVGAAAVA